MEKEDKIFDDMFETNRQIEMAWERGRGFGFWFIGVPFAIVLNISLLIIILLK